MSFLINNKIAIILYLVLISFAFILSARVEKLESKEEYYKYNTNVVLNSLN